MRFVPICILTLLVTFGGGGNLHQIFSTPQANAFAIGQDAFRRGSAAQIYSCNTDFLNVTLSYNHVGNGAVAAPVYGGAVYVQNGNVTVDSASFSFNTAGNDSMSSTNLSTISGGALYIYNSNVTSGLELNLRNASLSGNKSKGTGTYVWGGAIHTKGTSSYPVAISISDSSVFTNNHSNYDGGAIYAETGTFVTFSNVSFITNSAGRGGGALYFSKSPIVFETDCNVVFDRNYSTGSFAIGGTDEAGGGAIFSSSSSINFRDNCYVEFTGNHFDGTGVGRQGGGGVHLSQSSMGFFGGLESRVIFINNTTDATGGAIKSYSSSSSASYSITFSSGVVRFEGNSTPNSSGSGGAMDVYSPYLSHPILFQDTCDVIFDNNSSKQQGGAIYNNNNPAPVTFKGGKVAFIRNSANTGGALYSSALFQDGCDVRFSNNSASIYGGAISAYRLTTFEGGKVTFNTNDASSGGAINAASGAYNNTPIFVFKGGVVTFINNSATSSGGAVYVSRSYITFEENCDVTFTSNSAASSGGAIYIYSSSIVIFKGLATSTVTFDRNSSKEGGAISIAGVGTIPTVFSRGTVIFTGNLASSKGSNIYVSSVVFRSNDYSDMLYENSVVFRNNGSLNVTFKNYTTPPIYLYVQISHYSYDYSHADRSTVNLFIGKQPAFLGSGDKIKAEFSKTNRGGNAVARVRYYNESATASMPENWLIDTGVSWTPPAPTWELAAPNVNTTVSGTCVYNGPGNTTCPIP